MVLLKVGDLEWVERTDKFCSDCYKIAGFDIYPNDYAKRGYPDVDKKTVISEVCEDCYNDIKNYIHDKVFETAKKSR